MIDKLKEVIRRYNSTSSFKIRYRKKKNGYMLYLDYQRKPKRKTVNLNLSVFGTNSNFVSDKRILKKAFEVQKEYDKKVELKKDKFFIESNLEKVDSVLFFEQIRDSKVNKRTAKGWTNTINHYKRFTSGKQLFSDIDSNFCFDFKKYLVSKVSKNTSVTYFSIFKTMLNYAVRKGILINNPSTYIENKKPSVTREFLTIEEIKHLITVQTNHQHIKNAFLFSCFTGLRISDIKRLKWNNLNEGYIDFEQTKTTEQQRIKVSKTANNILIDQKNLSKSNYVFELPLSDSNTNKHLKSWIKQSGIDKHITYHCSRHTFATMCLTSDIDIYTVSKLLGHNNIKNTQIYAKLIDKKRDQAIDKLPEL